MSDKITIIQDTREQRAIDLSGFEGVSIKVQTYWPGDYSLRGFARRLAIERKSVSDLIETMTGGYAGFDATSPKRFDRTLLGMGGILRLGGYAVVVVEPDEAETIERAGGVAGCSAEAQITSGWYRSGIEPSKVLEFINTIREKWRVPVILSDSREHAAAIYVELARLVRALGKPPQKVRDRLREILAAGLNKAPEKATVDPW